MRMVRRASTEGWHMVEIALLLGGPSEERGISLNSARSLADHLATPDISLAQVIYFDRRRQPFAISPGLLYCNTPSDFDFKLSLEGRPMTRPELAERLRSVDIAFSAIHGEFGEDGE